jgi:hypothetical protein
MTALVPAIREDFERRDLKYRSRLGAPWISICARLLVEAAYEL